MASNLDWVDYVVIVGYFIAVLAVGLIASYFSKGGSVSGYFLASRNMHWTLVGASLFASNIGSSHFIGLAGSGAASGIGIAGFELNAIFVLMMLGWLFVPVYMSSGIYTMPEYLRERFGGQRIRVYLAVLSLILYIFTKISADLYAGALFIQEATGQNSDEWLYISVLILLAIAAVFTITGGLTAVLWTDTIQTVLMIIGAFTLMITAFNEVGGYNRLVDDFFYAAATNVSEPFQECMYPPSYSMDLLRPFGSDLPWLGMVLGATISSVWYWCTDQVIVQRTLASKTMIYAKAGCILASFLKFLPLYMLVFPGMAARILFPDEVACVEPDKCEEICDSPSGCTNIAYIKLVLELLPIGMRGLMLAVMMAALMSSLTSVFNSSSTIFTMDIWIRIRRNAFKKKSMRAIEVEQLIVGRLFVLVLVVISVAWIPVIQNSAASQLFVYIQSITSFLSPPICAVYVLAIYWERTTEPGVFWSLMVGFVLGMVRFSLELAYPAPQCGLDTEPRPQFIVTFVDHFHYLFFGVFLWVVCIVVTVAVSYMTDPIPPKCYQRLTHWTRYSKEVRVPIYVYRNEKKDDMEALIEDRLSKRGSVASSVKDTKDPGWKIWLYKICGFSSERLEEDKEQDKDTTEQRKSTKEAILDLISYLKEDPKQKMLVNSLAVVCLVLATWFFGFYA